MAGIIDPKKYFFSIIAGLVVLGLLIGSLVWSFLTGNSLENAEDKLEIEESSPTTVLEPVNIGVPSAPPSVPVPEKGPGES
jgi:hypothetical protein